MPLIRVPAHRPEDVEAWAQWEQMDGAWASTTGFKQRCERAMALLRDFVHQYPSAYISVSWGKDSVVVAHMAHVLAEEYGTQVPVVHVRQEPWPNPYTDLVRDEFLAGWPLSDYREYLCDRNDIYSRDDWSSGQIWSETLMRIAGEIGVAWIGGMRAEESRGRARRMARGLVLGSSCQPIGRWTAADVFAYLYAFALPVHPAYAMTYGGSIDRGRIRVDARLIPGREAWQRGTGFSRAEWEHDYYGPHPART